MIQLPRFVALLLQRARSEKRYQAFRRKRQRQLNELSNRKPEYFGRSVVNDLHGCHSIYLHSIIRWVAPVAALGYRRGGAEGGFHNQRSITVCLLCQGTPVGSNASQPVPPSAQPGSQCRGPRYEHHSTGPPYARHPFTQTTPTPNKHSTRHLTSPDPLHVRTNTTPYPTKTFPFYLLTGISFFQGWATPQWHPGKADKVFLLM